MEWADFSSGIIGMILQMISALAGLILAPLDLLINVMVPSATTAINNFFAWINSMFASAADFLDWMFYVLGITHATWSLIGACFSLLLLLFIVLFPIKMILGVVHGMRG